MIPLCFYPVQRYVKNRLSVLAGKIVIALLVMVSCVVLVGSIYSLGDVTDFIIYPAGIYFLYLYNREVRLSFSKKLFAFLSACLVGGFSKLYATMFDYTMHPSGNALAFSYEALGVQVLFLVVADVILYLPLTRYMGWVMENFHEEAVWKRVWCFPAFFFGVYLFYVPACISKHVCGVCAAALPVCFAVLYFFCSIYLFSVLCGGTFFCGEAENGDCKSDAFDAGGAVSAVIKEC